MRKSRSLAVRIVARQANAEAGLDRAVDEVGELLERAEAHGLRLEHRDVGRRGALVGIEIVVVDDRLATLADTAWVHVNRARQLILPHPGRVEATLAEHRAILAALEARDPGAARAATQAHLRQLLTFLEPLATTRPDLFTPR